MKKIIKIFLLLAFISFACQPDEFPGIGEKEKVISQLKGTWSITSVRQFDNDAQRKGFPLFAQQQDVTADFPYEDFKLTLDLDASDKPSTFSITLGDSPNIVGNATSGNWELDNLDFPNVMTFAGTENITLGSLAQLGAGILKLKVVRGQLKSGKLEPAVTYEYVLTKTN